jgi:hypothetical protein
MQEEMFDSAVRDGGDLAGVFEYEDGVGYFYLYALTGDDGKKVLDAIPVIVGTADFEESDIAIAWDQRGQKVGLFIRGSLWAVFDVQRQSKGGGKYAPGVVPALPPELQFPLPVH